MLLLVDEEEKRLTELAAGAVVGVADGETLWISGSVTGAAVKYMGDWS